MISLRKAYGAKIGSSLCAVTRAAHPARITVHQISRALTGPYPTPLLKPRGRVLITLLAMLLTMHKQEVCQKRLSHLTEERRH